MMTGAEMIAAVTALHPRLSDIDRELGTSPAPRQRTTRHHEATGERRGRKLGPIALRAIALAKRRKTITTADVPGANRNSLMCLTRGARAHLRRVSRGVYAHA